MKHLWDKGQMWPLFATTAAYAMNTFASEVLSGFSPFQLVFLGDSPNLMSLISQDRHNTSQIQGILQSVISKSSINWQIIIRMENKAGIRI